MEAIMNLVWAFLNSPIGMTLVVSAVGSIVAKIYLSKPLWKKYEGVLISAVKMAEKAVPDDSESKGAKRLDEALKYTLRLFDSLGVSVKPKDKPEIVAGIMKVHEKVEADGVLGVKVYD